MSDFPTVTVVGIEADGMVMPAGRRALGMADAILGWQRHLDQLNLDVTQRRQEIQSLETCLPTLNDYPIGDHIVLLATGDPLFYGIGGYLRERVPADKLRFIPARSAIQLAFAAIKESYEDTLVHSLHGRDLGSLRTPLTKSPDKLALFTEPEGNTPRTILEFLETIGCDYYEFYLCESLTGDDTPVLVENEDDFPDEISPLNVVLLKRCREREEPHGRPGVGSDRFRSKNDSMVSREEIRLLDLGWLNVTCDEVVWEIGAGTGSICIESARLNPKARFHAIEKKTDRFETLRSNVHDFETFNVIPRHEEAPYDFDDLPDPDRVILGGSGGDIEEILGRLDRRLGDGTMVLANFITLGNFHTTREFFADCDYDVTLKQITIHEDRQFGPGYTRWDEGPCFYLIRAVKT